MADTTARALRLLSLLQSRPVWTGPELAERLGVTERSIRRDMERLRELGYPVNAQHGIGGGYQLGNGGKIPPLLLDDDEAVAIAVSLRVSALGSVAGVGEAALRTLGKIDQLLPMRLRTQVNALSEATSTMPGATPSVSGETLVAVASAVHARVQLRFRYDARSGEHTERSVEPYRLVTSGRRWYLFAWDLDRTDWRSFRIDRMSEVHATTFRFTPRPTPDPVSYVQRSVTQSPYRHVAVVRLGVPLEVARERITAAQGELTAIDAGSCELTVGADDLPSLALYLAWMAHGLDTSVRVVSPPELRETFAALGAKVAAYGEV